MNDSRLKDSDFEMIIEDKRTGLYHLRNENGLHAAFTNYGARIVNIGIRGLNGEEIEVVAGYQTISQYVKSTEAYHGATVGRYCNRIGRARFVLAGATFHLTANDGEHALHGGPKGFHQVIWDVIKYNDKEITFRYISADMEEGYPGNLSVYVSYQLDDSDKLTMTYRATTDKTTVVNLTNHAYFNLNGVGSGSAMGHELLINAQEYMPVDDCAIPTGHVDRVEGNAFDFSKRTVIGDSIEKFNIHGGFNHNFVLFPHEFDQPVAQLYGDKSGIRLDIFTDQPGIQLYTGDHFRGDNILNGGHPDHYRNYIALETQHFPDSVNQPLFPSTVLQPDEEFISKTIYGFSKIYKPDDYSY